jgi:hypothetical protein
MNGPEPITSVSGVVVGILASRSGSTTGGKPDDFAMPSSTRPNGSFSVSVKVAGSTAFHSAAEIAVMARPMLSFEVQRCIEATTSAEVTGVPSENLRLGRSVKVQSLPSFDVVYLSTICGFGCPFSSRPKGMS